MDTSEMTINERAAWARGFFTRKGPDGDQTREAEGIGPILVLTQDCPKGVEDMVYGLHHGMPCDWIYEMVGDALGAIEEGGEDFYQGLDVDALYPYTHTRRTWHANAGYVSWFDPRDHEIGATTDPDDLISQHMQATMTHIGSCVYAWLEDLD